MILNNYFSLLSKQLLGLVGFNMKNKEKGLYHTRICVCILKIQQSVELCINFNIYFSICFLITTCFKYFFLLSIHILKCSSCVIKCFCKQCRVN